MALKYFPNNNMENINTSNDLHESFHLQHNTTAFLILNFNSTETYYRHSNFISGLLVTGYVFVFALGLVGNVFVVGVVLRIRKMRTVTNYFITNLAIADILVIVFCTPATLASNLVTREYSLFIILNIFFQQEKIMVRLCTL